MDIVYEFGDAAFTCPTCGRRLDFDHTKPLNPEGTRFTGTCATHGDFTLQSSEGGLMLTRYERAMRRAQRVDNALADRRAVAAREARTTQTEATRMPALHGA